MMAGSAPSVEGEAPYRGLATWYRVAGPCRADATPIVVVHGGPGFGHDYLAPIDGLADSRRMAFYDQIGCGRSARPGWFPQSPVAWLVGELENLLDRLGWADDHIVLGHSSGAVIAMEYAARVPKGLRGLVLSNAYASMPAFSAGVRARREEVAAAVRAKAGLPQAGDDDAIMALVLERHVCRVQPPPAELQRSLAMWSSDPRMFQAQYGPSLFEPMGALRNWSIDGRLDRIEAPTLVLHGHHDLAGEAAMKPLLAIPTVRHRIFAQSSHMAHLEEPDRFMREVRAFLADLERSAAGAHHLLSHATLNRVP